MNYKPFGRSVLTGVRNHPWWAAAVAVPVLAASVVTGTTMASAGPQPTLAVSASALQAKPSAHVMNFAAAPGAKRMHPHGDGKGIKESWHIDGCDHDYGTANQCVPWKIPGATVQAKCAWLQAHGFGPLSVPGTNRQHLPENAEGHACPANV
jgi:hypothetical protein